MDMEEERFPLTTRARSVQPYGSQIPRMTKREFATELERLAVAYPRMDMAPEKWAVLLDTFWEDMKNKTLNEIREGCRRYRQNPENRFFPSPGQLLEACKSPFDLPPGKNYEPALPLDGMPPDIAKIVIDATKKKYGFGGKSSDEMRLGLKEDILSRPKLAMTPELQEREKALKEERLKALNRKLADGPSH